jgi:hypothetical protein
MVAAMRSGRMPWWMYDATECQRLITKMLYVLQDHHAELCCSYSLLSSLVPSFDWLLMTLRSKQSLLACKSYEYTYGQALASATGTVSQVFDCTTSLS